MAAHYSCLPFRPRRSGSVTEPRPPFRHPLHAATTSRPQQRPSDALCLTNTQPDSIPYIPPTHQSCCYLISAQNLQVHGAKPARARPGLGADLQYARRIHLINPPSTYSTRVFLIGGVSRSPLVVDVGKLEGASLGKYPCTFFFCFIISVFDHS